MMQLLAIEMIVEENIPEGDEVIIDALYIINESGYYQDSVEISVLNK